MTFNLSDFDLDAPEPEDEKCEHTESVRKFSGAVFCANCPEFLGYWSMPRESHSAVRNFDGTFRLTS